MIQQLIEWMEEEVRVRQRMMEVEKDRYELTILVCEIKVLRESIRKAKELQAEELDDIEDVYNNEGDAKRKAEWYNLQQDLEKNRTFTIVKIIEP
jgi:hypothetical protein